MILALSAGVLMMLTGLGLLKVGADKGIEQLGAAGIGVFTLGLAQLVCKDVLHPLGIKFPFGVPFTALGLYLLTYSMFSLFNLPLKRIILTIFAFFSLYFVIGSYYSMLFLHTKNNFIFFFVPHVLELFVMPMVPAILLLYAYVFSRDIATLIMAIAFLTFALSAFIPLYLLGPNFMPWMRLGEALSAVVMLLAITLLRKE